MSDVIPVIAAEQQDRRALQDAIDRSNVRRAAELSMAEKLRMGADLYDDGIRLLKEFIRAEQPSITDEEIDLELDRRRAIVRRIDEAGRFRPYEVGDKN